MLVEKLRGLYKKSPRHSESMLELDQPDDLIGTLGSFFDWQERLKHSLVVFHERHVALLVELRNKSEELQSVTTDKLSLNESLKRTKDELAALSEKFASLADNNQILKDNLQTLSRNYDNIETQNKKLQEEFDNQKQKLDSAEKEFERYRDLESKHATEVSARLVAEQALTDLKADLEKAEQALKSLFEQDKNNALILQEKTDELDKINASYVKSSFQLAELEEQLQKLSIVSSDYQKKYEMTSEENVKITAEIIKIKREKADVELSKNRRIELLESKINAIQEKYNKGQLEISALYNRDKNNQVEVSSLKLMIQRLERQLDDFQGLIKKSQDDEKNYKNHIKNLEITNRTLVSEKDALNDQLLKAKQSLVIAQGLHKRNQSMIDQNLEEKESAIRDLRQKTDQLTIELSSVRNENQMNLREIASLRAIIAEKNSLRSIDSIDDNSNIVKFTIE